MTSPRHVLVMAALVVMGCTALASAQAADLTRITRVTQQPQAARQDATYVNSLTQRRVMKFIDTASSATVRFDVDWDAPSAGMPEGAVVVLDYRVGKSLETRSLRSGISSDATGQHVTTFYVQLPGDAARGGELAWRARILAGGKVLAARQSTLWR